MTAIKPRSPHAPGTTPAKTTAAPAVPQPQKPLTGWQQGGVVKMDPSTRHQQHGKAIALVEHSALLSIFGTKDKATGEVGIPVTQLRDLFQHQKLPPTTGASISESTAIAASMKVKVDANLSVRAFDSNSTITGQAKAGIRLANNGVSTTGAAANAAASAGKAANCPHLNNQAPMPGQVKDAVNAHTAVGLPR